MADPKEPSFTQRTPEGDDRPRLVCDHCGFIDYVNPRIVVGSVIHSLDRRIVMCKRAIEPRRGFWTLPAGFLETGESAQEGAMREAMEEASAQIEIEGLLAVYSVPRISQVQLMFRAKLRTAILRPGPESEDVKLFKWDDIPWKDLAFPSVKWALDHYQATKDKPVLGPAFFNPEGADPDALLKGGL